ncbi:hypothetical protein COW99_04865 [Candidatus Roizmanbacteria bacterium CG22_combo_CG10-13_8_21_14_all_38_20]|uniref:Xylose isomerase-like TIM barrel domain-containing protein n=1 Tax=Candidatus Roizmanbacteria bacterium CG22_combo_CG10-13_8_21_14_all_38_20 TaxID=1974862 RepID=A0A2H0BUE6_9BACT|nr:hypothetical protein [Candidatus Microgenomates bacterium]PIP61316.1 MAG: hypothetical protein COW99_04865 [Candidatus Roizmanbacteria bacterium CG22_combo_CG10-13_8_21_14_all_38_20]PJC30612.1 MAG: hypothetical protein CO050_05880 [Candidatus Roizmanbacteria bacterium CG_4_9_14_0_2_um_filter_38_17]
MIKLGIKVGANEDDIARLEKTNPNSMEVRFILEQAKLFKPVLNYAKKHNIQANFHHWAAFDGVLANTAAPGKFGKESVQTVVDTIDTAAENKGGYVVYHTGTTWQNKVDHKVGRLTPLAQIATEDEAIGLFTTRALKLHRYANSKGIQLILETTPMFDAAQWMSQIGRLKRISIGKLPISIIDTLADQGINIANDFEHTACNYPDHDHAETFDYLYTKTQQLLSQTKLLHLGYLIPPYNGTDYHGDLSNPEFSTDVALPNKNEMLKLLELFKNHEKLWIISEPKTDHVGSYEKASDLLQSAGIRFE